MFALHTSVKYWYEKYGCVVSFPLPGPGLSEDTPSLKSITPLRPFSTPPTTPKFWFAATASRSDAVSATATLDARVASSSPSFPIVGSGVREVPVEVHGLAPDGHGVDVLEVADQREGLGLAIVRPRAIRCADPGVRVPDEEPGLAHEGCELGGGCELDGIGERDRGGDHAREERPRGEPPRGALQRVPPADRRIAGPRRGGADVVSPRRCDGLLGPDAPRRHDRRDPVYRSSEGEAHGSVDRAPAPMGCDDKKSTSSACSRRRGLKGGFPAQPFRRHEGTDTDPTTSPARTERVNEPRATYTCSPSRNRCQLRARRLPGRAHSN